MTDKTLEQLVDEARHRDMSPQEREEQRRNFAFGNGAIANPRVTKQSVSRVAEDMKRRSTR